MQELEFLISQFVDGELDKEEKGKLFKELSINEEARDLFEEYLNLKKEIRTSIGKQLTSPLLFEKKQNSFNYKAAFYSSFAAVVFLIVVSLFSWSSGLTSKITPIETEFIKNNDMIINNSSYLEQINKMETIKITDDDLVGKKL